MKKILLFITTILALTACEKPAGEGGTSKISGNVTYFTTTFNAQTSNMDTSTLSLHGEYENIPNKDKESILRQFPTEFSLF